MVVAALNFTITHSLWQELYIRNKPTNAAAAVAAPVAVATAAITTTAAAAAVTASIAGVQSHLPITRLFMSQGH